MRDFSLIFHSYFLAHCHLVAVPDSWPRYFRALAANITQISWRDKTNGKKRDLTQCKQIEQSGKCLQNQNKVEPITENQMQMQMQCLGKIKIRTQTAKCNLFSGRQSKSFPCWNSQEEFGQSELWMRGIFPSAVTKDSNSLDNVSSQDTWECQLSR